MNHDVFISFSSVDIDVAKKVCEYLEQSDEVKCWIAFRDIVPSANYAEQLVEAIESSKLLLLILSDKSNRSPQVSREIERASSKAIPILPFKIEDVALSKSMEYFISSHHWLNAFELDVENYLPVLLDAVRSSLKKASAKPDSIIHRPKPFVKPAKKLSAQKNTILAAGLGLAAVAAAFIYLQPEKQPTMEPVNITPPVTSVEKITTVQADELSSVDALVKELAQRYKDGDVPQNKTTDGWTSSKPLSIAFLDISGTGVSDAQQDFILNQTAEGLRQTQRYSIVEREIIDKLLDELNLSTSALADPATALKLGKILSVNLIVTGSMAIQEDEWLVNLRFIETETTEVKCSVSVLAQEGGSNKVVSELRQGIDDKLSVEYPLQGKITSVSEKTAAMNIGQLSGVKQGMMFELLQGDNMVVDKVTVTSVEPHQSQIALLNKQASVAPGMLVREKVREE